MRDLEAEQSLSRVASPAGEWLVVIRSILLAASVFAVGCLVPLALRLQEDGPLPASLVSDVLFVALSIACAWWLSGGRFARYGFTFGTFRWTPKYLWWLVPMTIVTVLQFAGNPHRAVSPAFAPQSPLGVIGLVWIAASVGEEVLMRGLFQSSLARLAHHRVRLLRRWHLSLPVALSGIGFGVIHVVVLWSRIGGASLASGAFATVLGLIVGYERERTGSLLPAILIHTLFDIGASLPGWILIALFAH